MSHSATREDEEKLTRPMGERIKPDRGLRARAATLPWMGRQRRARLRPDGTPASPRIGAKRALRFVASGLAGVGVAIAAVWLAILYMPLPASQVIPRVQAALEARLGPAYSVAIKDAELHRGSDGVELRLVDLEISKAGGPAIATVPRAELRLDGLGLFGGEIGVRSVHATDPRLDMRFDTAVDAASKNADLPDRILAAIADLDRLLGADGAAGALEQVEVTGATLLVAPRARAPLSFEDVDLKLLRGAGGSIALTASSARAGDRWSTAITVTATTPDGSRVLDVGLENVDLAPYSAPLAEKAGAPPLKGRLTGHLNARIGADGRLLAGDGRLEARGIEVALPGPGQADAAPAQAVSIDRIQLALGWDPTRRTLAIEPSQLRGRGGQMTFVGSLSAPSDAGKPWSGAIDGRDVLLSGERPGEAPLRLDRIGLEWTFDPAAGLLEIQKAQVSGPTANAAATGVVRFEGDSPAIRLGVVTQPMPASAVKRLWPFFLAHTTRDWVVENVSAGRVDSLQLTIDLPSGALAAMKPHDPLPNGSLALDIAFSEGVVRGRPGLPWVEGASGRAVVSARRAEVVVDKGYVAAPGEGAALAVSNIRFLAPDLEPRQPPASVTFKVEGGLDRALALLASGSLGANPLPSQLDSSKVSGRVSADVAVALNLAADGPPPQIRVSADMSDVRVAEIFAGRSFEKGVFKLKSGDGPTSLSGKGVVGGAPASVLVTETASVDGGAPRRRLRATLTADAGDFTRLGLDIPGTLRGEVPLEAVLALDEPAAPMTVSADLANVGIDGLAPGFVKPVGRPGRLGFVVERGPERTRIKDFVLESGDRSVRGVIDFGSKGELVSATLPIYRPGPGDDARVEIDKTRSGVTKVVVQGAALDLKPVLDIARGKAAGGRPGAATGGGSSVPKSLDISAKLGTGLGYGGVAVAGLDLILVMRDGKVTDADGSGRIGGGAVKVATGEGGRLAMSGGDAGAFFRFADLYGRIDGGAFDLSASLAGGPGVLRIRNFAVTNETALDRVRRTTNADGDQAAAAPRGATRFDRLKVDFVQAGGQLTVSEAVVVGPQLGATLEGSVNYSADRVDLVGTFVPAYSLNNLLSRVPIIGKLLGGGEHGGLLGVTFQVRGTTGAPTVTVNPMSAVAPGFLRKIFEFRQSAESTAATPR